jgi:hypothetical protein
MTAKQKLCMGLISLLLLLPIPSFADDDDGEESIENLGWVAIGAGIIANLPFIVLVFARKIGSSFKAILNFHILLNSIGYFAGMTHGLLLSEHLDSISLSLAITMTVLMISGVLLRYTSSRNMKIFNRLLHGQFGLVILLVALIALHILLADD